MLIFGIPHYHNFRFLSLKLYLSQCKFVTNLQAEFRWYIFLIIAILIILIETTHCGIKENIVEYRTKWHDKMKENEGTFLLSYNYPVFSSISSYCL